MRWRRWLGLLVGAGAVVCGVPAAVLGYTFSRMSSVPDGRTLQSGAIVVQDGYSAAFIVPVGVHHVVLVDGGADPAAGAIEKALVAHGYTAADVVGILLTHGHADHTAACARFPDVPVYAGAPELDLLAGRVGAKGPLPRLMGPSPSPCADAVGVVDGQIVDVGGKTFRAYLVPGHTAGSAAWYADGTLYLGDAANQAKDGSMLASPWVFSDDVAQDQRSLKALYTRLRADKVPVSQLAFAHSGVMDGDAAFARFAQGP